MRKLINSKMIVTKAKIIFSFSATVLMGMLLSSAQIIATQPTSQIAFAGGSATFSVSASGTGLTYQWQFNGTNLPNNIITTIAGNGISDYSGDGGAATNAGLTVGDMAVDALGNIFIADTGNERIREVRTNEIITTVAGGGASLGDGNAATNGSLNSPYGVATDTFGNLFIADCGYQRVRKVNTNGIITTVAGNGSAGYSDGGGVATNAGLFNPRGVVVDTNGNIYFSDYGNSIVRKVNTNGMITIVAGKTFGGYGSAGYSGDGGAATNAMLWSPIGLTLDASGNLFIADYNNERIRKVNTNGIITTIAGNGNSGTYTNGHYINGYGDGGMATNANLWWPSGVCVDSTGNVFIADSGDNRIRKVDANGIITTVVGNGNPGYLGDGGSAANSRLSNPQRVFLAASGNLFIADWGNNRVRKVTLGGSPMLNLDSVTTNNVGNYRVIITSNSGSVTSSVVTLTVVSSPLIAQTVLNSNASLTLNCLTTPNASSRVLVATNLIPPVAWRPIYTNIPGASGAWQFTDTNISTSPIRFYSTSTP